MPPPASRPVDSPSNASSHPPSDPALSRRAATSPHRDPPRTTSRDLLGARGELVIAHDGREYRLRITQNNRLILTA